MKKIFDLYMALMGTGQSEIMLKHTFGALRSFISKVRIHGEKNEAVT